jgi:membrane protein YqaA with SNARE-associated domain
MRDIAMQYGYLGIFVISLIGSASILIPIPYTVIIFTLSAFRILDPMLIALSSGLGSAVGEFSGYLLGYYGQAILSDIQKRKIEFILKVFNKYGAITVFIFALTPLPDDLLIIPLGIMRYSFVKVLLPCLLGKIFMSLILAYGGAMSIGFIQNILGEEGGMWSTVILTITLIIIIVAMLKIDWEKFLLKRGLKFEEE